MKLLFSSNSGTATRETALKDTNFEEHYPSINGAISWQKVKPYIKHATQDLLPLVSRGFYDKLTSDPATTENAGSDGTTSVKETILELAKDALA
jgi:hypothetical protein